jgi:hypothetical protein
MLHAGGVNRRMFPVEKNVTAPTAPPKGPGVEIS